ncbi:MAG: hypothetical protein ABI983_07980 [Acidobacteriota bacterium]
MKSSKLQPALLAGVAIGVLSSLPIISLGNACCCAWVVFGGALAAYLLQQNDHAPVTAGDGAVVGLMAGVVGAVVGAVLSIVVSLAAGPYQSQMIDWILSSSRDLPPEARSVLEEMRGGVMGGALAGIGFIVGLVFSLVVYSIFGLLGGLLGAVLFRKPVPPPAPPPPMGFSPATFTPPSFEPPPLPPPPVS